MKYNVIITDINDNSLNDRALYSYYSMILFNNDVFLDNFFKVFEKNNNKYIDEIIYNIYTNLIKNNKLDKYVFESNIDKNDTYINNFLNNQ
jgi:hypothetical protein